jgi:hypothetical protein
MFAITAGYLINEINQQKSFFRLLEFLKIF